ncbi:MAG: hypothetical protein J5824_09775 [Lachnospiraceae bacterium]|nr:hypothetical protein [Lachnospiraceae bacterium]
MKIAGSTVSMNSEHRLCEYSSVEHLEVMTRNGSKALEKIALNAEAKEGSMVAGMREFSRQEKLTEDQQRKENEQNSIRHMLERMNETRNQPAFRINDETDTQIKLLRRLLAALSGKGRFEPFELDQMKKGEVLDLRSSAFKKADMAMQIRGTSASQGQFGNVKSAINALNPGTSINGTVWQKITATSGFHNESELTTFKSTGLAMTEDGRSISFGMELSMSRSFTAKFESLTMEEIIVTDPLIINIDNGYAGLTDVKFKFDLDSDGKMDEISFAGKGSGFLALDKDGNGKIDDGSELFGTKSGDGFADLAAYDDDGNSWIDENDEIYSKLKVWTKDADGNDKLMNLKEANVGAIYLGSASTEFSIKDGSNALQGAIRKTGIYLKETGEVGTLQHVDLAM